MHLYGMDTLMSSYRETTLCNSDFFNVHAKLTAVYLLLRLLLQLLLSRFARVLLCATPETAAHRPGWLRHPWDSPGKNTGVGCHFLLQCRKVKSESEVAQSCLTSSDAYQAPPSMGFARQEYRSGVLLPSLTLPANAVKWCLALTLVGLWSLKRQPHRATPELSALWKPSPGCTPLRWCTPPLLS